MPSLITTVTIEIPTRGPRYPVTFEALETRSGLASTLLSQSGGSLSVKDRQLLIFFPGNPGMVQFYRELADLLVTSAASGLMGISTGSASPGPAVGLDVLVVGYAGHTYDELNDGRVFELKDQEALAIKVAGAAFATIKREELDYNSVYLGGHSIGGYIASLVADKFRSEQLLRKVFLLAPTLCYMRDSPAGRSKAGLLSSKWNWLAIGAAGALRFLVPSAALKWLILKGEPSCTGSHADTVLQILRPSNLRNVFFMAKAELERVYELDSERLDRIRDKVVAWFPKDDHWCPLSFYRIIATALGVQHFTDCEIFAGAPEGKVFSNGPVSPICAVDSSDAFLHAWCLKYNTEVATMMIVPFCTAGNQ